VQEHPIPHSGYCIGGNSNIHPYGSRGLETLHCDIVSRIARGQSIEAFNHVRISSGGGTPIHLDNRGVLGNEAVRKQIHPDIRDTHALQ
jgi:hypothetical protein